MLKVSRTWVPISQTPCVVVLGGWIVPPYRKCQRRVERAPASCICTHQLLRHSAAVPPVLP